MLESDSCNHVHGKQTYMCTIVGLKTEGPSIGDPSRVQFPDNGEPRTYITQQFACTSLVPVASSWCRATTIVEIPPQKFQNTSIDLHRMQQKKPISVLLDYIPIS
jgi:hypothetical protein